MTALLGTSHILRKVLRLWAAGRSWDVWPSRSRNFFYPLMHEWFTKHCKEPPPGWTRGIHLIPKWPPFRYSFVFIEIRPWCLVRGKIFFRIFSSRTRHQGLIWIKTKEHLKWRSFWNKVYTAPVCLAGSRHLMISNGPYQCIWAIKLTECCQWLYLSDKRIMDRRNLLKLKLYSLCWNLKNPAFI